MKTQNKRRSRNRNPVEGVRREHRAGFTTETEEERFAYH